MIRIDASHYPIVIARFSENPTNAELEDYCVRQQAISEKALADGTRYVMITIGSTSLSTEQRRLMSEWIDAIPAEQSARVLGAFVVIENPLMRGILTAIKWTSRQLKNVTAVGDREEALERALALLEQENIAPPAARPSFE